MIILSFTCIFNISQAYREKNIDNNIQKKGERVVRLTPLPLWRLAINLFERRLSLLFNVVFTALNRLSDFGVHTLFPNGIAISLRCALPAKVQKNAGTI